MYPIILNRFRHHPRWCTLDYFFDKKIRIFQLRYAKNASLKLIDILYYRNNLPWLKRKDLKLNEKSGTGRGNFEPRALYVENFTFLQFL